MDQNPPIEPQGEEGEHARSLWSELGLPEMDPLEGGEAPEVDREVLLRLVRRELSERAARVVYRLIYAYANWNDAHTQLLVEEFVRRQREEQVQQDEADDEEPGP